MTRLVRRFHGKYLLLLSVVGDHRLRDLVDAELDRRAKAQLGQKPQRKQPAHLKAA